MEAEKVANEEYKTALQFEKEVALDAMTPANKVALATTIACSFVKNTDEVVVAAHLFNP